MMTHQEVQRWSTKCDSITVLDPNLKPEILKKKIAACVAEIETLLRQSKRQVVVCVTEMR